MTMSGTVSALDGMNVDPAWDSVIPAQAESYTPTAMMHSQRRPVWIPA
jgi:hypothetical protein